MTALSPNPPHASSVAPSARPSAPPAAGTARPLAFLLLAAAVAALAVAADHLMTSWADAHLLATWIALWVVMFVGILTLAGKAARCCASASPCGEDGSPAVWQSAGQLSPAGGIFI